jgi:thioredoxin-like negative regulator of GroEL
MDVLEGEGVKIKKVNCDYDTNLSQQYKVKSVPTLVLTDLGGNELGRKVGVQSKQQILDWYNG